MKHKDGSHCYYKSSKTNRYLAHLDFELTLSGQYKIHGFAWGTKIEEARCFKTSLPVEIEQQLAKLIEEKIYRMEINLTPIHSIEINYKKINV
ncbi:hypothetical protein [Bacillus sp. NPDC094106]|uniref:hypothetical protein n=1 Tax=Bacillus sp. NPDC094106 TaxID=3363949 RepID=UPI0037F55723